MTVNAKCKMMRDLLSIEDPTYPLKGNAYHQSTGYVYNALKIRTGFLNRVHIVKDELAKQDKNKKPKPTGYVEDTSISTLMVTMRVFHSYYREVITAVSLILLERLLN